MRSILLVFFIFLLTSFSAGDLQYREIRNEKFKIEFYVSLEKKGGYDHEKRYYWYKSGEIHSSVGEIGGDVLEGKFMKYYKTNQLAEKGDFKNGLKVGEWNTWHKNGRIQTTVKWRNGMKNGRFELYDSTGNILLSGRYRSNLKQGEWIDYRVSDTLKYRKGTLKIKDSIQRGSFFGRLFKKKERDTLEQNISRKDTLKEKSFFKRVFNNLFKKKEGGKTEN